VNDSLKELISRSLEEPENFEVIKQIRSLRASDADFSDELFEAFAPESRYKIYPNLVLWTDRTNWLRILERRANSEADWECNKRLQFMITGLKGQTPE